MEEDKKKDKGGSVQPEAPGFMSGLPRGAGNVQTSQQPIVAPVTNVFAPHAGVQGRFERGGAAPDNPTMQSRKDSPAEDTPLMRGQGYGRSSYPDSIPTRDTPTPEREVIEPINGRTIDSSPSSRNDRLRPEFNPEESMPTNRNDKGDNGVDEIDTGYRSPLLSNIEGKEDSSTKYPFEGKRVTVGWDSDGEPVYGDDSTKSPYANQGAQKVPEFKKDETKKDGGFFNWLGSLVKKRNGKRPGESDDEYDERMTRNKEKLLVLGDALRHMGNLYLTSKGGLSQKFNSPTDKLEADLKYRKAERAAKAAKEAEAGYKNAMLNLKINEQNANNAYRQQMLGYKQRDGVRADARLKFDIDKYNIDSKRRSLNDAWEHAFKEKQFAHKVATDRTKISQGAQRIAIARERNQIARGSNMTKLASPKGSLLRKKELSAFETYQIWNFMKKNGNIPANYMKNWNVLTPEERAEKIKFAISVAASDPSKEGARMREYLKKHHGYIEEVTDPRGLIEVK